MFGSKESKGMSEVNSEVIETIVGFNTEVEGSIVSQGSLRVDGKLHGNVNVKGNLIIGEKGLLKGDVVAKTVVVAGEINGNINALEKMEINKSGKVVGDIFSKFIVIEEGAHFTGHSKMGKLEEEKVLLKDNNKKQ